MLRNICVLFLLLMSVSCQTETVVTPSDELTDAEFQHLLKEARIFVSVAPRMKLTPITADDKKFINTHEPKCYPRYTGYKRGEYKMVWRVRPGYSVRVIAKGELLEPSCKFRLTVSRFAE